MAKRSVEWDDEAEALVIDGKEYFGHGPATSVEVPRPVLAELTVGDLPEGISVIPMARILGSTDDFYSEGVVVGRDADGAIRTVSDSLIALDDEIPSAEERSSYLGLLSAELRNALGQLAACGESRREARQPRAA